MHRLLDHFEEHHVLSSSPATPLNGKDGLSHVLGSPRAMQLADLKRRAMNDVQAPHSSKAAAHTSSSLSNSVTPAPSTSAAQAIPSDGSFHMDDVEMDVDAADAVGTHHTTSAFDLPSTSAFSRGLAAINTNKAGQTAFANRRSTSPSSTSSPDNSAPSTPIMDSDMDDGASDWDASASTTSLADIAPNYDTFTPSMLYPSHMQQAFHSPAGSQRTSPDADGESEDDQEQHYYDDASDEPRIVMGNDPTIKHLNHKGRTLIAPPPTLPSGRAWVAPAAKPFKCTVPGCDKAYKQQNGLKYHRLHGNCNNRLGGRDGEEGSLDGRETLEEKPYGCYVGAACGKRYKK